jgi:hypothetical protein
MAGASLWHGIKDKRGLGGGPHGLFLDLQLHTPIYPCFLKHNSAKKVSPDLSYLFLATLTLIFFFVIKQQ